MPAKRTHLCGERQPECAPWPLKFIASVTPDTIGEWLSQKEWREAFAGLHIGLAQADMHAEVFIWDDMHARFLITDLIGIQSGNGFDTTAAPGAWTTWSRISRETKEGIQREFSWPNNNRVRDLRDKFAIGA